MRKLQKLQIVEQIKSLGSVCKELENQNGPVFVALCIKIQELVSQIVGYVGDIAGEDAALVKMLKEFYEMLFRAAQGEVSLIELQRSICQMESAAVQLKPDKIEMVFFSYKASMSDSLESIYFTAKEDSACDAYFIPIPYFDRNPDGTLGEMHLEGVGCYSDEYDLTDWQEYDIEVRCPDIVFIMNPYDDGNYVTSVHPDFYAKRLKKWCGILCYVPYFVTNGHAAACALKGTLYADYVFVQSESVKQDYINVIRNVEGRDSRGVFGDLNKKIVALGSPKFDKVINGKREDYILPVEWTKIIGDKKVVLYNTTVYAVLQHKERYLVKIRSVLSEFRNRKDAVLWWRPHPLMEQTLASMHPKLAGMYRQIVEEYRSDSFGIYDDSVDVNRAVVYTDYYYGDGGSSVDTVFLATGKPVMVQNIDIVDNASVAPVILGADDSKLYFSPLHSSAILSLDLVSNEIEVVKTGHITRKRQYSLGVKMDDVLYFTPGSEENILRYDTKTKEFTIIPYKVDKEYLLGINPGYQTGCNFLMSYAYKGKIFFVGCFYPAILCYNTMNGQIDYRTGWPDSFKADKTGRVFAASCQMGSRIVMANNSSVILFFDMETNEFSAEEISCSSAEKGFSTIAYGNGFLWLMLLENGTILRFNPLSKEIVEYSGYPQEVIRCESMCIFSIYSNGELWFFSDNTNAVLRLNTENGEISVIRLFSDPARGNGLHLGFPLLTGNKIYASRLHCPGLSEYDIRTGSYTDIPMIVPPDTSGAEFEVNDIYDTILMETGFDGIDELLHTSARNNDELMAEWISTPDGTAGEKIYHRAVGMFIEET